MVDTRVLTIEQAAAILAVSEETLRRLARNGAVPCLKVGGEWRFPADIAERMMRESGERAAADRVSA